MGHFCNNFTVQIPNYQRRDTSLTHNLCAKTKIKSHKRFSPVAGSLCFFILFLFLSFLCIIDMSIYKCVTSMTRTAQTNLAEAGSQLLPPDAMEESCW